MAGRRASYSSAVVRRRIESRPAVSREEALARWDTLAALDEQPSTNNEHSRSESAGVREWTGRGAAGAQGVRGSGAAIDPEGRSLLLRPKTADEELARHVIVLLHGL